MAEKLKIQTEWDDSAIAAGMKKTEGMVKKHAKKIAMAGAAGFAAFGLASVKAAADAQTAIAKLETIAGPEVEKLKKQIMELDPALGGTAAAAEAAYQAISAGRPAGEAVQFVAQAAKAAKGGFTDVTTAVDAATTIMNSYGAEAGTAQEIFDKFLRTQNLGKTTFGELGASIGDVAATAKDFGVPFDSLLGQLATLTASGIRTPKAITSIRAAISNLQKPTADAQKEFEALGITADQVREMGVMGLLDTISARSKDTSKSVANIFGSVEAATAVNALIGNLEKTHENIASMGTAAGDADKAFGVMSNTLNEQVAAVGVSVTKIMEELGGELLPAVQDATQFVLDNMGSIKEAAQGLLIVLETITGTVADISSGIGAATAAVEIAATGDAKAAGAALGIESETGQAAAGGFMQGFGRSFGNFIPGMQAARAALGGGFGGPRQIGGPVSGGKSYMVGEQGPEIVTMGGPGSVLTAGLTSRLIAGSRQRQAGMGLPAGAGGETDIHKAVRKLFGDAAAQGVTEGVENGVGTKTQTSSAAGLIFDGVQSSMVSAIVDGAKDGDVKGSVEGFAKGLGSQVFAQVKQALVSALGKKLLGSVFGGGIGGFFADGGRPPVGMPSIVGERGPELFVPDRAGTIVPNEAMGGTSIKLEIGQVVLGQGGTQQLAEDFLRRVADGLGRMAERGQIPHAARRLAAAGA